MVRDLTWGDEHIRQGTDDVLWKSVSEICIIWLSIVTPRKSIKRKNK